MTKYKHLNLYVDNRVVERVKNLFIQKDIYEVEEEILHLLHTTRFIVDKNGTKLTLAPKED